MDQNVAEGSSEKNLESLKSRLSTLDQPPGSPRTSRGLAMRPIKLEITDAIIEPVGTIKKVNGH